jgi:hypothetical protein
MTVTESKEQKEGKEKKIGTKPYLTTIYAPLKKKRRQDNSNDVVASQLPSL